MVLGELLEQGAALRSSRKIAIRYREVFSKQTFQTTTHFRIESSKQQISSEIPETEHQLLMHAVR